MRPNTMNTTYRTDVPRHGYPGLERSRRHGTHREEVMRNNGGICHLCGGDSSDAIDHIVPVAWGGSDEIANLAPAHSSCNSSKGASRDTGPDEYTWHHPEMWIDGYGPNWNPDVDIEDMEDTREGIGDRFGAMEEARIGQRAANKRAWSTAFGVIALFSPVVLVIAVMAANDAGADSDSITGTILAIIGVGIASLIACAATSAPKKSNYS